MSEINVGQVYYDVTARLDQLEKGLAQAREKLEAVGKNAKGASESITAGFLKSQIVIEAATRAFRFLSDTMQKSVKAASNLQETQQKFGVVFQNNIKQAEQFAKTLQEGYGLSENAAKSMLAHTGDILQGFGMQEKAALDLSMEVQKLTVDLVSFTNYHGTMEEASRAITKAMLGEAEALESLGKKILDDDVKRRAQADGYKLVNGQIDNQARAVTVLKLLTEQSKNAIGDFQRSSDSFANTMRVVDARLEDISAEIGKELLPSLSSLFAQLLDGDKATNPFIQGLLGIARAAATAVDGITALAAKYSMAMNEVTINKQREGLELLNKAEKELLDNAEKQYAAQGKVFNNRAELLSSLKQEYEQQLAAGDAANHTYEVYEKITTTKRALADETSKLANANIKNEENLEKAVKRLKGIEDDRAAAATNAAKQEIRASQIRTQLTEEQIAKLREMYREWLEQYLANGDVELASIETRYEKELQKYKDMLRAKVMSYGEYVLATTRLEKKKESEKDQLEIQRWAKDYDAQQRFISLTGDSLSMKGSLRDKMLAIRSDFNQSMLEASKEAKDQLNPEEYLEAETTKNTVRAALLGTASIITSTLGGISELQTMAANNRMMEIDNEAQAELKSIENQYQAERAHIEATVKDRGERDAALKALDEKRSRDERAVQERADKEKRKIQHETAKQQKIINKTETIIAGAVAAIEAYKAMSGIPVVGPGLGAAAAAAITALTYEKVRLIEEQPLPPLARGALIQRTQGGTPVIVGEGRHDEAVIPLNAATFDMLGERMVAALMSRAVNHSVVNTVTNIDNRATVEHPREPIHIYNVIELDGEVSRFNKIGKKLG